MSIFHRKSLIGIQKAANNTELKRNLTYIDITLMGIGVTVGSGIFVLTGIGAAKYAGPGITLSFIFAGITCSLVGLAYAELASIMPTTGSVYTYTYSIFGEVIAWIVALALALEYLLTVAVVTNGCSEYLTTLLKQVNINIPKAICTPIGNGGIVDLPGALILALLAFLLLRGTKESMTVTRILVAIKLSAIFIFFFLAVPKINLTNWSPFLPFGFNGIFTGASFVFMAYLGGFEVLSSMAEESVKPSRDIPIGIVGSLAIVTALYAVVSITLTGIVTYTSLETSAPMAFALGNYGYRVGSALVGTGIIFGLTAVILGMMYAQNGLFLAISRDGLIPKKLCKIHPKYKTPYAISIITGIIVIVIESTLSVELIVELINMGALFAFLLVSIGTLTLRIYHPEIERPFKCPKPFIIMPLAIASCIYLIFKLEIITWLCFICWSAGGLMFYLLYGYWNSSLHKAANFRKLKTIVKRIRK